jgi:ribose transport system permease protein
MLNRLKPWHIVHGGILPEIGRQTQLILLLTAALVFILGVALPGFATFGNAMALLRSIAILGIFGLGMAIVVIGRGIDLSQIAVALVAAGITAKLLLGGAALPLALGAGLFTALSLGLINGAIIAYCKIPALFTTLASAFLFVGVARILVLPSIIISLPKDNETIQVISQNWLGVPIPFLLFAISAVCIHLFLSRTVPGRFIYAHGDNPDTARLTGLPVNHLVLLEYVLSAVIGYLGGLLMVSTTGIVDLQAVTSTLIFDVILVVILGGISLIGGVGSIYSVVAGALLIGVLLNAMTIMDINSHLQNIIKGSVLLGAIVLDSWLYPRDEETARQGD